MTNHTNRTLTQPLIPLSMKSVLTKMAKTPREWTRLHVKQDEINRAWRQRESQSR